MTDDIVWHFSAVSVPPSNTRPASSLSTPILNGRGFQSPPIASDSDDSTTDSSRDGRKRSKKNKKSKKGGEEADDDPLDMDL